MTFLHSFLLTYGSLGIFIGSIIEEIIAPIPSTAVIFVSSAFILLDKPLNLNYIIDLILYVGIPAAAGMTIGSSVIYAIGHCIGKPFINKWGKYLGLDWESIEKLQEKFKETKNDDIFLFAIRAIPVVPSVVISGFCGVVRYNINEYIAITFFGSLIRASIIGFLGWQFGNHFDSISNTISQMENFVILIVIIAAIYLLYKHGKDNI